MKIEKLTENKIRIIIKQEEFTSKNLKENSFIFSTPEFKKFFSTALDQAEKEVNFKVDDCKLLIELFSQSEDTYMLTVTKYIEASSLPKKRYTSKKIKQSNNLHIYQFDDFENFCNLCTSISCFKKGLTGAFKSAVLYFYNNTYYLVITDFNLLHKYSKLLKLNLLEFSTNSKFVENFEFKLLEHGKVIIKNNALNTGIKYFR